MTPEDNEVEPQKSHRGARPPEERQGDSGESPDAPSDETHPAAAEQTGIETTAHTDDGEPTLETLRADILELEKLAAEMGESRTRKNQVHEDNEALRTQLRDDESKWQELSREKEELEKALEELKEKLEQTASEKEKLRQDDEQLRSQIEKLQEEVADLSKPKGVDEGELAVAQRVSDALQAECDSLKTKLGKTESELARLQEDSRSAESKLAETQSALDNLKTQDAAAKHLYLATKHIMDLRRDEAIQELKASLELDPQNAVASLLLKRIVTNKPVTI